MLGWLCFEFPRSFQVWDKSDMTVKHIFTPYSSRHLANSFKEGLPLYIPNCSTYLCDNNIIIICSPEDALLNLIGNMGDNLHSPAKVTTMSFFRYDCRVNFSCRYIVVR
ncbi:hypothetical protein SDC9_173051 [bioreactor metagenome]|uniref:Uncharacterized protein n=1 Tax=bioreactor metagenome TaxID=1076179 RepID=A0A645GIK8_9ZZZZ